MPTVAKSQYACFARWTYSAVNYAIGTDEGYRAGAWHDPVMTTDADLSSQFSDGGIVDGNTLTMLIADGATGIYRTLVAGNVLDGTSITVETVCSILYDDNTTAEQSVTQVLTVQGTRLQPGRVAITLVDLEDTKLDTLYPELTYSADLFRDMDGGFAGRAIPYPVGTARKLICPLISADSTNAYWHHAVCDAELLTLPIIAVSTGSKTFTVAGDYTGTISAGTVLFASTSSANPGRYTVTGAVFGGVNTVVTVSETVSSATVSGNLLVPPTVLAVYRDGRLVASSEYTVEMTWPVATQLLDSDFDNSPADWSGANTGSGTAAVTAGVGRFTGDGTASNYGRLIPTDSTVEALRGAHYIATIKLATTGKIRLLNFSVSADGSAVISNQGTHTALVRQIITSGSRRVDISNYKTGYSGTVDVDNIALNTTHRLLFIRFLRAQVGFDGQPYSISADVRGVASRNVATEIGRLLTVVGCTPDSTSFGTAEVYATTHSMLVDVDHGRGDDREGGQRRVRALLTDLLFIARATLSRNAAGHYVITQDRTASIADTLDEDLGDAIEIIDLIQPTRPKSVSIRFAPNPRDPGNLTYTISRNVTGGIVAPDEPRDVRYLTDATAADELLCYRALRAQYNHRLRFRQMFAVRTIGEALTISSANTYPTARPWYIDKTRQLPGGVECEAIQYTGNVHTYTPGTLPAGANTSYQPDYSQTPPGTPTAMSITAGSVATAGDGTMTARITVKATPPAVNWAEIWFAAVHNTTAEIAALIRADSIGAGEYGCTASGIRPGEVYKLQSYAVNAFNVSGAVQSSFSATAIGGGSPVTTFTAPGQAALPSDVASISRAQGMGRIVNVSWSVVTGAAIWGYVVERQLGAGLWVEVFRGQATSYRDTDVTIGDSYTYRVKARDTYGNLSTNWRTGTALTTISTVSGGGSTGDVAANTIATNNRTAVTGVSVTHASGDILAMLANNGQVIKTVAHSLGKLPTIGGLVYSGSGSVMLGARNPTSTDIDIIVQGAPINPGGPPTTGYSATYVKAEQENHTHEVFYSTVSISSTSTIYLW